MLIDPSKVNLVEADIEEYLWRNPDSLAWGHYGNYRLVKWVGRQVRVPSGIIDLLGIMQCDIGNRSDLAVVEIKNGPINASAIAQVCRYTSDIVAAVQQRVYSTTTLLKIVIGTSIDTQTMFECEALNVTPLVFSVNLSLSISPQAFTREFDQQVNDEHEALAQSQPISEFVAHLKATIPEGRDLCLATQDTSLPKEEYYDLFIRGGGER